MPAPTVYLETFGCQMNVLDSQLVRGQLQSLGYRFINDWQAADVILYNTCSVRERAEQKVWSRVGEVGIHKRKHPHVILGVIGCMAERDGKNLQNRHPQVDILCGPGELDKVPLLINNAMKTGSKRAPRRDRIALQGNTHRRSATLAAAQDNLELLDLSRSFSPDDTLAGGYSAYVRITRGCNKFCTYCVVPNTRGREIHRPPDHLVTECRKLVEQGAREITLLGQTVNHYHYDTAAAITINGIQQPQIGAIINHNNTPSPQSPPSPRVGSPESPPSPPPPQASPPSATSFAQLLARINDEVPDLPRLRFITSFPRDFGDDILEVIRDRPRICQYLHLPVQSASNRILKLMNRGYTVEQYRDLIDRVRDYLPKAELATDIICGFPTETEQDHQATMDLLRYGQFKNSFIFKYSPRPGTVAIDRLPDDIPPQVKKRRNNELLAVQADISTTVHKKYIGRTVEAFVESISSRARREVSNNAADPSVTLAWETPQPPVQTTQLTARTATDLIVCFEGNENLIGQTIPIQIDRASPLTLFGQCVSELIPSRR